MALLFDTDFSRPSGTRTFRHLDGRAFTYEEQALADEATLEELQAAGVRVHNPQGGAEAEAAATELARLVHSYALRNHQALVQFMTHEDMLEYDRLCGVIVAGADS
ncbi:hypothetical protein [Streptomyces sp. NPDC001930]|uniref:hypothetical protein n=1 Tax=Streptomyces sp. NPDC001930 TaxID=3364625 RepID=UPI0036A2F6EE